MPLTDEQLLTKAIDADADALGELLKRCAPQLRGRIAAKIGPQWRGSIDEDDVLQVTFLEAFLIIDRFSPRGHGEPCAAFLAWITHIAENNLRDAIKELQRAKRPDPTRRVHAPAGEDSYTALVEVLGVTTTTPSRHAARGEAKNALDSALSQLPPDYEKVIRLFDLEGKAPAEVAAEIGRSQGAIFMLRARAHEALKRLMGPGSRFFSTPGNA